MINWIYLCSKIISLKGTWWGFLKHFSHRHVFSSSFFAQQQIKVYRYKILARFGLMHMIGTNLSVWFSVLIQETKHEILTFYEPENLTLRISHRLGEYSVDWSLKTWKCFQNLIKKTFNRSEKSPSSWNPLTCCTWIKRTSQHFRVPSIEHFRKFSSRRFAVSLSMHDWVLVDLRCHFVCHVAKH